MRQSMSHFQLHHFRISQLGIFFQDGKDLLLEKVDYLLRCSSCKCGRIHQLVQLLVDRLEIGTISDALNQIVIAAFLLHHSAGLLAQNADLLMTFLFVQRGKKNIVERFKIKFNQSYPTCLSPPALTMARMMFSVAIKGSSSWMERSMTFG